MSGMLGAPLAEQRSGDGMEESRAGGDTGYAVILVECKLGLRFATHGSTRGAGALGGQEAVGNQS